MKEDKSLEEMIMTGDIVIIKLPPGICQGAIETYPEKYLKDWDVYPVGVGLTGEGSPRKKIDYKERYKK